MHLYNVKIDTTVFENITKNFNPDNFKDVPLIAIYYNTIMLLLKPEDESYYYKLKNLIVEIEKEIDPPTLSDVYINLENYCHRKGRVGVEKFFKEALDIYKLEIKSEACFNMGIIPYAFYNSYIITACRLKEFDDALVFMEKYKEMLSEENRDDYYFYSFAFLENERGNNEKALEYLSKVKMDDLYMKMDIRSLQCRIYDALGWYLPLQSLLDTFKKTVQNNKLMPDIRKKYYLYFIKYLNHLNNLKQKPDSNKFTDLKYQIESEEYFPYKSWLIKSIEELGK
jgi:tetratricopeptide (TPR) repeat protein